MNNPIIFRIVGVLIALSALADTQLELLQSLGLSDGAINGLKLLGLVIALLLPSVAQKKTEIK
jgi:hypothetical protein